MRKAALLIIGLLAAGLAIAVVVNEHASWWQPVVLAVAPDLALVAGGLAWVAHVAFGRSLGFGLRSAEGFQRRARPLSPTAGGGPDRS